MVRHKIQEIRKKGVFKIGMWERPNEHTFGEMNRCRDHIMRKYREPHGHCIEASQFLWMSLIHVRICYGYFLPHSRKIGHMWLQCQNKGIDYIIDVTADQFNHHLTDLQFMRLIYYPIAKLPLYRGEPLFEIDDEASLVVSEPWAKSRIRG